MKSRFCFLIIEIFSFQITRTNSSSSTCSDSFEDVFSNQPPIDWNHLGKPSSIHWLILIHGRKQRELTVWKRRNDKVASWFWRNDEMTDAFFPHTFSSFDLTLLFCQFVISSFKGWHVIYRSSSMLSAIFYSLSRSFHLLLSLPSWIIKLYCEAAWALFKPSNIEWFADVESWKIVDQLIANDDDSLIAGLLEK